MMSDRWFPSLANCISTKERKSLKPLKKTLGSLLFVIMHDRYRACSAWVIYFFGLSRKICYKTIPLKPWIFQTCLISSYLNWKIPTAKMVYSHLHVHPQAIYESFHVRHITKITLRINKVSKSPRRLASYILKMSKRCLVLLLIFVLKCFPQALLIFFWVESLKKSFNFNLSRIDCHFKGWSLKAGFNHQWELI